MVGNKNLELPSPTRQLPPNVWLLHQMTTIMLNFSFKGKDSQCLQSRVNFSLIIVLRQKQHKSPTIALNKNIFMRREISLCSANYTSTLLRKKVWLGSQWTHRLFPSISAHRMKRGTKEQSSVLWFPLSILSAQKKKKEKKLSALNMLTTCLDKKKIN